MKTFNKVTKDTIGNDLIFNIYEDGMDEIKREIKLLWNSELTPQCYENFIVNLFDIIELESIENREDRSIHRVGDGSSQNIDHVILDGKVINRAFLAYTGENGMVGIRNERGFDEYRFGNVSVVWEE